MIALLHAGGWDEMLLLGVALILGFGLVMFGGKKKPVVRDDPEQPTPEANPLDGDAPVRPRDDARAPSDARITPPQ